MRKTVAMRVAMSLALMGLVAAVVPAVAVASPSGGPAFGPNVIVFNPSMPQTEIQSELDAIATQQVPSQFGTGRYAIFFEPGTYGSSSDPEEYDFFETGGSSLDAVNLAEEISAALGHSLDPATLYYHPTFDELVASVADTGSDTGRWPGWSSAGFFLLDIGIADGGTADTRCEVLTRLLGQMPLAWRKGPNAGPSGDYSDGGDTVPVLDATDRAAELVTTVGDAGLLSLRAEWPLGSVVVRLSVRAERATPEADALDAVARAAAASGLGTIVHSVFGEMFAA